MIKRVMAAMRATGLTLAAGRDSGQVHDSPSGVVLALGGAGAGWGHGSPNIAVHLTPWAARLTTLTRVARLCESQPGFVVTGAGDTVTVRRMSR